MKTLQYDRTFSFFEPDFTYKVTDLVQNRGLGSVARNKDNPRRWWASNKTWNGGGDLVQTFTTRHEAAVALRFVDRGADPAIYGGYADECTHRFLCKRCGAETATGIGYVQNDPGPLPAPAPDCPETHHARELRAREVFA